MRRPLEMHPQFPSPILFVLPSTENDEGTLTPTNLLQRRTPSARNAGSALSEACASVAFTAPATRHRDFEEANVIASTARGGGVGNCRSLITLVQEAGSVPLPTAPCIPQFHVCRAYGVVMTPPDQPPELCSPQLKDAPVGTLRVDWGSAHRAGRSSRPSKGRTGSSRVSGLVEGSFDESISSRD